MPVNFIKIFQDSWNFILNQKQLAIFFWVVLMIDNLVFRYLLSSVDPSTDEGGRSSIFLMFAGQVVNAMLTLWFLSVIMLISQQRQANLSEALSYAIRKIPLFLLLNFVIILPLSLAAANYIANAGGSIFTMLSVLLGVYLFIRLSLTPYSYAIENSSFSEALKLVWLNGMGRVVPLALFAVLAYLLPLIITLMLGRFPASFLTDVLVSAVSAAINIFTLVFTYRFYQLFIDKTILRKFQ